MAWACGGSLLLNFLVWRVVAAIAQAHSATTPPPIEITRLILGAKGARSAKVVARGHIQKRLAQLHREIRRRPPAPLSTPALIQPRVIVPPKSAPPKPVSKRVALNPTAPKTQRPLTASAASKSNEPPVTAPTEAPTQEPNAAPAATSAPAATEAAAPTSSPTEAPAQPTTAPDSSAPSSPGSSSAGPQPGESRPGQSGAASSGQSPSGAPSSGSSGGSSHSPDNGAPSSGTPRATAAPTAPPTEPPTPVPTPRPAPTEKPAPRPTRISRPPPTEEPAPRPTRTPRPELTERPQPTTRPQPRGETHDAILLHQVDPRIPEELKNESFKKSVRLRVEVDEGGNSEPSLRSGSGNAQVDELVLAAVRRWRWRPALKEGAPVSSHQNVRVDIEVR